MIIIFIRGLRKKVLKIKKPSEHINGIQLRNSMRNSKRNRLKLHQQREVLFHSGHSLVEGFNCSRFVQNCNYSVSLLIKRFVPVSSGRFL